MPHDGADFDIKNDFDQATNKSCLMTSALLLLNCKSCEMGFPWKLPPHSLSLLRS